MSELKNYVESLFRKYGNSKNIDELKAEILSNLEAKKSDLIMSGLDEKTATHKAKESIKNIDNLIDDNKYIYINQLRLEVLQQFLLYLVITWILTIPIILFRDFLSINLLMFCFVLIVGIVYLFKLRNKTKGYIQEKQYISLHRYVRLKRIVWEIWGIFITVCMLVLTGVYFGSNIWFSRPIHIDGPYAFALLVIRYFVPFVTLIIPLTINNLPKLVLKFEAGENIEE